MRPRQIFVVLLAGLVCWSSVVVPAQNRVTSYVRYAAAGATSFGILDGETIRELKGDLFAAPSPTGRTLKVSDVRLLQPVQAGKAIGIGLNYKSHTAEPPKEIRAFAKFPTSIVGPGEAIVFPPGATDVHYEGELVLVIGRTARRVSEADAPSYVFGVTAGNDVSERIWQASDNEYFRAKASDTFGPIGPAIVQGLNYNDLQLTTRLNGKVVQTARTSELIFSPARLVSFLSQYITLEPGDLIFTGTPGTTSGMKPGDTVEVELEGIGILRNPVVGPGGGTR